MILTPFSYKWPPFLLEPSQEDRRREEYFHRASEILPGIEARNISPKSSIQSQSHRTSLVKTKGPRPEKYGETSFTAERSGHQQN